MLEGLGAIVAIAVALVFVLLFLFTIMARLYRKVGPNQALIVYGVGGTRIVNRGGAVVVPMVQTWDELSLELLAFDVAPTQDL